MLWFFIVLAITILAFVIAGVFYHFGFEGVSAAGILLGGIGIIALIIMAAHGIKANTDTDAYVASMQQRYEALTYQLDNDVYDNLNDIGKRELYEQVRAWNEDLARRKKLQNSDWVGMFYANVYDQFELIPLQ